MSDHHDPVSFRKRVYMHGRLEPRIARRHPTNADADPWRFAFSLPAVGRLLCVSSLIAPAFAKHLAGVVYGASLVADRLGMEGAAMRGVGLVFGLDYFRGLRDEAGSLPGAVRACLAYTSKTQPGAPS
jgi:hypothetical protein